jgi:hypothetical protein
MNGNPSYMIVEDLSHHRAYARVFQPGSPHGPCIWPMN